jgi:hypothetical protein
MHVNAIKYLFLTYESSGASSASILDSRVKKHIRVNLTASSSRMLLYICNHISDNKAIQIH